jgi:hypothetical protein
VAVNAEPWSGAAVPGHAAARHEQVGGRVDHVRRGELAGDPDRERLARELVDHAQHPELPPVPGPILDEVVGPHLVRPFRPQADARSIGQPEAVPPRLARRHLEPLPPPDPLDPLAVGPPAGLAEQRRDPTVAVPAVAPGQPDDLGREPLLIIRLGR